MSILPSFSLQSSFSKLTRFVAYSCDDWVGRRPTISV
ncbi:Uncharacterised protein [Vibrio cholerae]|nr:Uncharacterised protein [Vibrio cholerae]